VESTPVPPVHPLSGGQLDLLQRPPGPAATDELGLVSADLFALYVYGAITFAETEGIVDLDYHAIVERPPTPVQIGEYDAARVRLGREHALGP